MNKFLSLALVASLASTAVAGEQPSGMFQRAAGAVAAAGSSVASATGYVYGLGKAGVAAGVDAVKHPIETVKVCGGAVVDGAKYGFNKSVEGVQYATGAVVKGAKAAFNGTVSYSSLAGKAAYGYAKEHPVKATAVVAAAAGVSYLAYKGYKTLAASYKVKAAAALARKKQQHGQIRASLVGLLNNQRFEPSLDFYLKDGFANVKTREIFHGTPAFYVVDAKTFHALNDAVSVNHALNCIVRHAVEVEASVKAQLQQRFDKAMAQINKTVLG